nr:MAG TPA: hypothetical protein [Caudoviricetes sp.]
MSADTPQGNLRCRIRRPTNIQNTGRQLRLSAFCFVTQPPRVE